MTTLSEVKHRICEMMDDPEPLSPGQYDFVMRTADYDDLTGWQRQRINDIYEEHYLDDDE